jgi:L-alanine-DL-glutamate epimerase-like enolase superfamily enzyme
VILGLHPVSARLRGEFAAGHGVVGTRQLLVVSIESADGHVGYGEAAPLESYDGVGIDDVHSALEDCRAPLADADDGGRAEVLGACARVAVLPHAVAAIDLALLDLEGHRRRQPAWQLLGAQAPRAVELNWMISAPDRSGAAREAAEARAAGFSAVKVKVAIGDDAGRLAAVRAFGGPQMVIRIDANGAWSEEEAIPTLKALEPVGIEFCEEPVAGVEAIAALDSLTPIRLAIDESAVAPAALARRACDLICLKIARCGGTSGLIDAARRARDVGYEVFLASTLDGPLGIAAALHAAAVVSPQRPCGLATLSMFDAPLGPLAPTRGWLSPPPGDGLGDGLLRWYGTVARDG